MTNSIFNYLLSDVGPSFIAHQMYLVLGFFSMFTFIAVLSIAARLELSWPMIVPVAIVVALACLVDGLYSTMLSYHVIEWSNDAKMMPFNDWGWLLFDYMFLVVCLSIMAVMHKHFPRRTYYCAIGKYVF